MKDRSFAARTDRRATLACLGIAAAAGVLWVLATEPIALWPLGWIALAPTLWLVDHAPSPRRAALYAWTSGTVASLGGFRWIVTLLTEQAGLPWPLGLLGLVLLASYNGLVFFFMARAIRALRRKKWPMAICAPLALVTFEKLVPMVFPYFMAITQAPVPIAIQVADLAGPYAVTAMIAAASGAIVDGIARRRKPGFYTAGVIAMCLLYGATRMHQVDGERDAAPHVEVALISSGMPARADHLPTGTELAANLHALQDATAAAEKRGAELAVWSEAAYEYGLRRGTDRDYEVGSPYRIRTGFTIPLVFGSLVGSGKGAPYNSAVLLEPDGTISARHDKVHRVLGSEYNPILETWPSTSSWMPTGAGYLAAGDAPTILHVTVGGSAVHIGAMICFEDILPKAGREIGARDPNLLVNISEDSWFGPDEPWQHQALAVFRAVEVRSDLVRAVNLGPSSHVDAAGRIVETGAIETGPQTLIADVALVPGGGTVYCAIGDTFAWLCALPVLFLWLVPWLRHFRWWRPGHAPPPSGDSGAKGPRRQSPKKKSVSRRR